VLLCAFQLPARTWHHREADEPFFMKGPWWLVLLVLMVAAHFGDAVHVKGP
jgi:hypothetical protein